MKASGSLWSRISERVFGLAICAMLLALCSSAHAQQTAKNRLGYVTLGPIDRSHLEALRQGLRNLGYTDGKNIEIEIRYAGGKPERVSDVVTELVQHKVDVLIIGTLVAARAAREVTKTIPIVVVLSVDPVSTGLVDSLAHPGGNVTGLTYLTRDLSGKRLELLREVIPGISRVGVLRDADDPSAAIGFKEYEAVAGALKIQIQSLEVRGPTPDLESVFQAAIKGRAGALITIRGSLLRRYPERIAALSIKNRLPSMYEGSQYVEAGGLMSYATDDFDQWRRAAIYVDKILKGAKPADLPVEQPTKFEFIINLKTAKQIALTIPPNVLARADRVIK
jgi:ABC-type uncharacterized transport system substrate-binding protein